MDDNMRLEAENFLEKYESFVRWYYGDRCQCRKRGCDVCRAWKRFDEFADELCEKADMAQ